MADYKRVISYMYNYEKQTKKNNVGYARIEIIGGQCKITIHMKVLSVNEKYLKVYMFYRKNSKIRGVCLGDLSIKNGIGECRILTKSNSIMDSGYSFDQMGGIIVYVSPEKYFGTEWDDIPISYVEFDEHKKEKTESIIEQMEEKEYEITEEMKAEVGQDRLETSQIPLEKEEEKIIQVESLVELEEDETQGQEEKDVEPQEVVPLKKEEKKGIDEIFQKYPRMYPFEDDEILECVRIEPRDIGIFPMDMWGLANNSFLLHGYYSYRHLIFAKKQGIKGFEYCIGIPGIYHNREQFMARMFGFADFKSVKKYGIKPGEFGYWYKNISI